MDFAVLKKVHSDRPYENIEFRTIVNKQLGMEIKESKPIFDSSSTSSQKESVRINFNNMASYHSDDGILPMRTLPRFRSGELTGRYYYYPEHGHSFHSFRPQCDVKGFPREGRTQSDVYTCRAQPSFLRVHPRLRARPSSPPLCNFCQEREKRRVVHAATQVSEGDIVEALRGEKKNENRKSVFHWPSLLRRGSKRNKKETSPK